MKLYFIRHGETIQNKEGIIQGWHGGELSPLGHQQSFAAGKELARYNPTLIISSDLHRTIQTTHEIRKSLNHAITVLYDWRLRERNFGQHEGNYQSEYDWDEIFTHLDEPELYHEIETNPMIDMRIKSLIKDIQKFHHAHDSAVIVTHGGILNCISKMLDPTHTFTKFDNTAIVEAEISQLAIE